MEKIQKKTLKQKKKGVYSKYGPWFWRKTRMKYVGSKRRVAKELVKIFNKERKAGQYFVEPFCGSASVSELMSPPVIAADENYYLICLLKAVQGGWIPPDSLTEEEYYRCKYWSKFEFSTDRDKNALIGFAGFGCSYAAKWWGGYARGKNSKGEPRNYAAEQKRNLLKRAPNLKHIQFVCSDYRTLGIPNKSILYMDPPYKNTTKYSQGKFNHKEFWEWCAKKNWEGHTVFVSEYNAPPNWKCVWQKEQVSSLTKNTGSKKGVEKLFVLEEL